MIIFSVHSLLKVPSTHSLVLVQLSVPQRKYLEVVLIGNHCLLLRGGYEAAAKNFNPSDLEDISCTGSSYMITGANSGTFDLN